MNKEDLILAIDGGGSTSQVALYDMEGNIHLEESVGSLSLKSTERELVLQAFMEVLGLVKPSVENIKAACFGLSGLDSKMEIQGIADLMMESGLALEGQSVRKHSFGHKVKSSWGFPILLCSDAILPLFANGFHDGVVVISGTGSIALRVDADGACKRIGGWGYQVSDEGSGTWIGLQFIHAALHAADYVVSRGKPKNSSKATLLKEAWLATSGSKNLPKGKNPYLKMALDLEEWSIAHTDPKVYTTLARAVIESRGSECRHIREKAESHLARLATLAAYPACTGIVLSGGTFHNDNFAMGVAERIEAPGIDVVPIVVNKKEPTFGAFEIGKTLLPKSPKPPKAHSPAVRKSMQGNKGSNTKPELLVRRRLREAGITGYRLHWKAPGHPDIAWPGRKVCVFINGCFWHRHPGCKLASMPKSNTEYWLAKFDRNVERDAENLAALKADGWRVHVVWECELAPDKVDDTMSHLIDALKAEVQEI